MPLICAGYGGLQRVTAGYSALQRFAVERGRGLLLHLGTEFVFGRGGIAVLVPRVFCHKRAFSPFIGRIFGPRLFEPFLGFLGLIVHRVHLLSRIGLSIPKRIFSPIRTNEFYMKTPLILRVSSHSGLV